MTDPLQGTTPPAVGEASFDAYYYAHCCGDPYCRTEKLLQFFNGIADRLIADIGPRTVFDAGCAIGLLVEALRARGVDAWGADVSSYAIGQVPEQVRPYCSERSVAEDLPQRYDLIVCIEVLEHMPAREAEAAIANFCRHTDDVVFSSSPLDYKEPTHINVHPPEHWAAEFARYGFYRDVDFDASYITPWAARFRRSTEPVHRIVRSYERRFWELTLERNDTRAYSAAIQRELAQRIADVEQLRRELEQANGALAERDRERARMDRELSMAREHAAQLERSAAETSARLAGVESELARVESELARVDGELREARERIANMERSAFWRARTLWQRVRGGR